MIKQLNKGVPYPLGVTKTEYGYNFAVPMECKRECGIVLYKGNSDKGRKIPFSREQRVGSVYCGSLPDIDCASLHYNYYADDREFVDPYARKITGHDVYGKKLPSSKENALKGGFLLKEKKPALIKGPELPFEEVILYVLHVRGFTKHISSNVTNRGTFRGIMEKIPYLKELGVTSIELLPAYEFDEVEVEKKQSAMEYSKAHYKEKLSEAEAASQTEKINYWGFKKGYYFAPKASYTSRGAEPEQEFQELINCLHENHMELIMQFYFPNEIKQSFIQEVLRFWVLEYGIDGIHLQGDRIPAQLLSEDPLLQDTKLFYYSFPEREPFSEEIGSYGRNLGVCTDDFMVNVRKFLKSDEDTLTPFLFHMRQNPENAAVINTITNYYGFTLMDLVSYDRKHNEENGENNTDGSNYNYSWNCGAEGPSRKKAVLELRMQQIKNALTLLILAQGTPLLVSGDEFGNSQKGNNNPYCQDNGISWLNWNGQTRNQEIYAYTRALLALRKRHPILHMDKEMRMLDTLSCGYPDLSYHGEEVWAPVIDNYNRHVGILYCGKYAHTEEGKEDDFFYIAYNMHWLSHEFALPKLSGGLKWKIALTTNSKNDTLCFTDNGRYEKTVVQARSIVVLKSEAVEKETAKRKKENRK